MTLLFFILLGAILKLQQNRDEGTEISQIPIVNITHQNCPNSMKNNNVILVLSLKEKCYQCLLNVY